MEWYVVIGILCVYGFIKEFRPSEPFLNPYLMSPYKNFTNEDLSSKVYPVATYSSFLFMIPIFLFSDPLRYKVIVVYESLSYASCWALLLWGTTIPQMQLMQFFYGTARVAEVAFYGYTYAFVENKHYKRVTSFVRASVLFGDFLSYGLSQLLVTVFDVSYVVLNYISFVSTSSIVLIALTLPWLSWKNEKSLKTVDDDKKIPTKLPTTYCEYVRFYFVHLWQNFRTIYSTAFMWKWSLWWALAACGFYQIGNYAQNLWSTMQSDTDVDNGLVECINTFLGALVVFLMQFIHVRWEVWGEMTLAIVSAIDCFVLLVMSKTHILVLSYCCYSLTRVLYQFMIAIAMYNVAKRLKTENYGLVFGFNTWIAVVLQTIFTVVVPSKYGLDLPYRIQFVVYGAYYGLIAIVFLVMGVQTLYKHFSSSNRKWTLNSYSQKY